MRSIAVCVTRWMLRAWLKYSRMKGFHAKQDMLLWKIESGGDASLKLKGQRIDRTAAQIVHLCAHPQQKIVALIECAAFGITQEAPLEQLGGGVNLLLKVAYPEEIVVIAQASDAILDVGLLHKDAPPVFRVSPPDSRGARRCTLLRVRGRIPFRTSL